MSEWQDMQHKPNTKLRDLLKSKIAKTRELSELSKTEQNRLAELNGILDKLIRGENVQNRQLQTWLSDKEHIYFYTSKKNVLSESCKNQYNMCIEKTDVICM